MSLSALFFSLTTVLGGIKSHDHVRPHHSNKTSIVSNKTSIASFTAAERMITHQLGDKTIAFKIIQYGNTFTTCCVNLHDNERTSVEAARMVLQERGGLLIKIENNAQRMVSFTFKGLTYSFDPNRIFSPSGIAVTLKVNGKKDPQAVIEVEKFAAHLLQLIPDTASCIIALHNNTNNDFSIKTYMPGGNRQHDAKLVFENYWQDVDDIALTTDETIYNGMSTLGYNSILQDNINVNKDGSLSVYYGEQNKRYINIETEFGKTAQYKEMLAKLFFILDDQKKPVPPAAMPPNADID